MRKEKREKGIYIYGAGLRGESQSRTLLDHGYIIEAIVDSDEMKWGKTINDISIISPQELYRRTRNSSATVIISTPRFESEIRKELENNSFNGEIVDPFVFHRDYEVSILLDDVRDNGYIVDFERKNKVWFENLLSEVEFWKKEVVSRGGKYYEHYKDRVKNGLFQCNRIDFPLSEGLTVLDVGCGICSQYGNLIADGSIDLTGIDPLAYFYNELNKNAGNIEKKVKFGMFELLSHEVNKGSIDIILIDNALDHCIDPMRSICECIKVLKKGGTLSMCHHIDEAYKAFYTGLHQWNIGVDTDGSFIIWNKEQYINVEKALGKYVSTKTYTVKPGDDATPYGQVVCNIKKLDEIPEEIYGKADIEGMVIRNAMGMLSNIEYSKELLSILER